MENQIKQDVTNENNQKAVKQETRVKQMEMTVYSFPKNTSEEIQCKIANYSGKLCLGLYTYKKQPNGTLEPANKGICMKLETWQEYLPKVLKAAQNALE